jgi:hypothetical protein
MNNSEAGCATAFIIIAHIASFVISGTLAWNWVEPETFGQAILFIIAWGIIGYIVDMVLILIVGGIITAFNQ